MLPSATPPGQAAETLSALLAVAGADPVAWLRAWARVSPTLVLVPIFGGSALPAPARAGLGFALAVAVAPALRPVAGSALPLSLQLMAETARGVPIALGAALLVHAALMAGGAVDDLRGQRGAGSLPVFDTEHTPLGGLLGLLVAVFVLQSGGAARLIAALAVDPPAATPLAAIIFKLTACVGLAVAVAAPVAGAAIVTSVAEALLARAASPAHVSHLLAPLRSIVLLAVTALVLERMLAALTPFVGAF